MRILMIGAGGVGDAAARIAVERDFFDSFVVADYDLARAEATVASATARREGESRFVADQVDASDSAAVTALALRHGATHVFNAVDPRFVMPILRLSPSASQIPGVPHGLVQASPDARTHS
jgi:saccharopine dehydrogenase-like NADP-dependent oxidoreductase